MNTNVDRDWTNKWSSNINIKFEVNSARPSLRGWAECDGFLQLFRELNLQLDGSIVATQKVVLVILTACVIVCDFYFVLFFIYYHSLSLFLKINSICI